MPKIGAHRARHVGRRRFGGSDQPGWPSEEATVTGICDSHGAALFTLAVALLGDVPRAEAAVVEVIRAACMSSAITQVPADQLRGELARRVHELCGGAETVQSVGRCGQQRYAVAVVQQGGLDYREAADLLGVSTTEVVEWLGAALQSRVRI